MDQFIIFPFAQGSEASTSDCEAWSQTCERWLWWRGKHSPRQAWSKRWRAVSWIRVLSTRTCFGSRGKSIEDSWISSLEASRVNRSVMPDAEKRLKIRGTCGLSSSKASRQSSRGYASSRMSTASPPQSLPDTTRFSTMSSKTWSRWVIDQRREGSRHEKSELLTCVVDGSSLHWPTPDATMRPHEGNVRMLRRGVQNGMDKKQADAMLGRDISRTQGKLPALDGLSPPEQTSTNGNRRERLNPEWVEALMGFPIGWTGFDHWGTPSSLRSPGGRS
jgi:hypothetical protein